MADRFSSAIRTALAAVEAGPKAKPATLRIEFPQPAGAAKPTVVVDADTAGASVTPVEATSEPLLFLANSVASADKAQKYIAIALDPDAPFPSMPFLGPILHGAQTNLVLATTGPPAGEDRPGWTQLTSETPPLIAYVKPGPPSPSAAHRYVFILYKQPAELDSDDATAAVRTKMGWPEGIARRARMRFDANTLETKLGLGEIVAINFFRSQQ